MDSRRLVVFSAPDRALVLKIVFINSLHLPNLLSRILIQKHPRIRRRRIQRTKNKMASITRLLVRVRVVTTKLKRLHWVKRVCKWFKNGCTKRGHLKNLSTTISQIFGKKSFKKVFPMKRRRNSWKNMGYQKISSSPTPQKSTQKWKAWLKSNHLAVFL